MPHIPQVHPMPSSPFIEGWAPVTWAQTATIAGHTGAGSSVCMKSRISHDNPVVPGHLGLLSNPSESSFPWYSRSSQWISMLYLRSLKSGYQSVVRVIVLTTVRVNHSSSRWSF